MSFDIYGENLRQGHCEVHPNVHEEYPCSVCLSESSQKNDHAQQYQKHCDSQAEAYYSQQHQKHCEYLAGKTGEVGIKKND